jgi:hypothetical protein
MGLLEYLPEFVKAFTEQITSDNLRWGQTWRKRPRLGQVERMWARLADYKDQFDNAGTPIPWLKIVGEAFIGWVRDNYPDYQTR